MAANWSTKFSITSLSMTSEPPSGCIGSVLECSIFSFPPSAMTSCLAHFSDGAAIEPGHSWRLMGWGWKRDVEYVEVSMHYRLYHVMWNVETFVESCDCLMMGYPPQGGMETSFLLWFIHSFLSLCVYIIWKWLVLPSLVSYSFSCGIY